MTVSLQAELIKQTDEVLGSWMVAIVNLLNLGKNFPTVMSD